MILVATPTATATANKRKKKRVFFLGPPTEAALGIA